MRLISTRDQAQLARVLALAFKEDPVLRWVIPDDRDYARFAEGYFDLQIQNAATKHTNDAKDGIALWIGPDHRPNPISQWLSTLKTIWLLKTNLTRAYRLQEIMDGYRPKRHFLHLTHVATLPESQGGGVASRLLKPMLDEAKSIKLPVYLECSNQSNLGFYRQFGFRLVDDVAVTPQGPIIWPMVLDY